MKIVHKSAMFATNGVLTKQQAIDMATNDFLSKGLNCIEYSNGNRVNIASYAQMAVNTASQRAMLQGEGELRKKIGNSLIKISKHGTACKLCQPWERKILIDDVYSGGTSEDGKYPLLSTAMKQDLYHPNCRYGLGTYYPELDNLEFNENGPTKDTMKKYQEDINYCNLQIQRYKRLEAGSKDQNNINKYTTKKKNMQIKKRAIIRANKLNFKNVTNDWIKNATPGIGKILYAKSVTINGVKYEVNKLIKGKKKTLLLIRIVKLK